MDQYRCLNCNATTMKPSSYAGSCRHGEGCGFKVGRFAFEPDSSPSLSPNQIPEGCFVPVTACGISFVVCLPIQLAIGGNWGDWLFVPIMAAAWWYIARDVKSQHRP